ncbi:hypothetical protein NPIL_112041 [Nephila pilipes]|uniref:Uncharacterized protein n=1 Tax=Nephila pilipes TaxID=299642 RepID=A0A8X6PIV2_NEPPI|nr:hypothetical protein NPIL_112041 [Nephila pilipes]
MSRGIAVQYSVWIGITELAEDVATEMRQNSSIYDAHRNRQARQQTEWMNYSLLFRLGPVDLKLRPNQEIILWYKPGPWNPQLQAAESKKSV